MGPMERRLANELSKTLIMTEEEFKEEFKEILNDEPEFLDMYVEELRKGKTRFLKF